MKAYPIKMEIAGDTAMWTRPDTGDCPVSYPAPTYSAMRNIFQSILWGQAVEIIPTQVDICRPLNFQTYNTNYRGPLRKQSVVKTGGGYQLMATVLTDVCYRLYADVIAIENLQDISEKTKEWCKKTSSPGHAYQEIFERRLKRGQCFHTPFLGWKEFTVSYFGPIREESKPVEITTVLPSMFRDVQYGKSKKDIKFIFDQNVEIINGVLRFKKEVKNA